ncbi:MAG: cytochrome c biogenesis protein ResB [Gammaproteobacteria bacterium]
MNALRSLASTKLTLFGMAMLGIGAALSYDNPVNTPVWVLVIPMALLALNLFSAILTNGKINRNSGLLLFHISLLTIVILAAIGRLTHMEARIELAEGSSFSRDELFDVKSGVFHNGSLDDVRFVQESYTVDYAPRLTRGSTRNSLRVLDANDGWRQQVIGDDTPLVINGYRFYTTFNKGFSTVLTWIPERGAPITGIVNMPSYPLFSFRQANSWSPPGSEEVKFWLQLDTGLSEEKAWTLDRNKTESKLVVKVANRRVELNPGEAVQLSSGKLRYERLSSWMGYKLFYDPTLYWLFISAIFGIIGLSLHYWKKFGSLKVSAVEMPQVEDTATKNIPVI